VPLISESFLDVYGYHLVPKLQLMLHKKSISQFINAHQKIRRKFASFLQLSKHVLLKPFSSISTPKLKNTTESYSKGVI
jgi:hypothetical protein